MMIGKLLSANSQIVVGMTNHKVHHKPIMQCLNTIMRHELRQVIKCVSIFFVFTFFTFSSFCQKSIIINTYIKGDLTIKLIRIDTELCYQIQKNDYNCTINLDRQNIVWKSFPSILWTNDKFACVMTYWTGPLSYHLMLPLDKDVDLQYFIKDIEESDSINNNICFIDKVMDDSVIFIIQNLITKKKKSISLTINELNGIYPFYETITLTRNTAIIKTEVGIFTLDLRDIYNAQ